MSNVEFDRIIEMASPEHIGDDRQLITFTILKIVGALATRTLRAIPIARTLTHEQAVLRYHEFGVSHDGRTERHRTHLTQLFDLAKGELG